jgi:prepilin-type N-terminal cleavage/methylation domain-containing protein
MEKKRVSRGFTLIELVIVIVIISILSVVSVPMYRGYVRRAYATEGRTLVGSVCRAEKVYLVEKGVYLAVSPPVNYSPALDIDARTNQYFQTFSVTASGSYEAGNATFEVTTTGVGNAAGITIVLTQPWGAPPAVTETGT